MSHQYERGSVPMSPVPPSSPSPSHPDLDPLPPLWRQSGYRPADVDETDDAYRYRARKGLEVARRVEAAQGKFADSIDALSATITLWSDTWTARWRAAAFLAKALGLPILAAAGVGLALSIWRFVSTLHH